MKKTYVLDTNVLLSDPNSLYAFQDNEIVIPLVVLEELDANKTKLNEVGQNARQVNRTLDSLRITNNLFDGVKLQSGGILRVKNLKKSSLKELPSELDVSKVDNMIIAFMLQHKDAILVTQDIAVRLKCDSLGIKCEDYKHMRAIIDEKTYTGVAVTEVDYDTLQKFYAESSIPVSSVESLENTEIQPNQIIVLKNLMGENSSSALSKVSADKTSLVKLKTLDKVYGLKPKNKEQAFSLDLLLDPSIKLVTLSGRAGTGKTLLALAAGAEQLNGMPGALEKTYSKLIVTKPVQPMGKDIGYLPGDLKEKMDPWIAPIRDNLEFLMGTKKLNSTKNSKEPYLSLLQEKGVIEVEALTFIRGRSIHNAFFIIDEAQNLSLHELKTIITRVGEGTKIVLTGDIDQIDNTHVDKYNNGLTYAIEKFKSYPIAAHVSLLKGERSDLATLASQIL